MSLGALAIASVIKILFVLLVVVGAFAPMIVWAERRQSAMMQDRLGPRRAGIILPPGVVNILDKLRDPLAIGATLAAIASALCGLAALFGSVWVWLGKETPSLLSWVLSLGSISLRDFFFTSIAMAALFVILRVGYAVHTMIVKNRGNIALLGLLHPLTDAMKFIFKEDFIPPKGDKFLHSLAPIISLIPAVAAFTVIPFANVLHLEYWNKVLPRMGDAAATLVPMQIASLNIGILFIFAIAGTGVIGAAVGGYASDNKFSLIGGVRAASQMVSYEVALGLTLVPAFMIYNSLRLEEMALWQHANIWGIFIPPLTLSFILFFTAAIAETKRIPFDLPEGESELVGGYLTEYSGMKFGMFFMSEFVEVVGLSAIAAVVFFGGWDIPFLYADGLDLPGTWSFVVPGIGIAIQDQIPIVHGLVIAIQVLAFLGKIVAFIFIQLLIRWSLPRFRYDQVMALCWKGLLPLALLNILITGALIVPGWLDRFVAFIAKVL